MSGKAYILLHDIRSVYNVGSIFRTADAAGISKIFLSGFTPSPIDRFGRKRKDLAKVSLGAEDTVSWEYGESALPFLTELRKEGVQIVGIEQSKQSVDYKSVTSAQSICFVVGSEVGGLDPALREQCDVLAEIPMRGTKDSLNVSVALGIALFRMLNI